MSFIARAQDVKGHYFFNEIDIYEEYMPSIDTVAKYKMRALTIDVIDEQSGEKKISYLYTFDRRSRITQFEKKEKGATSHTIRKVFEYNRKNLITSCSLVELSVIDSFGVDYHYKKKRLGKGLERWYRYAVASDKTTCLDSVSCAIDKKGRVVMLEQYWSRHPQKTLFEYFQRGDTSVVKFTEVAVPSFLVQEKKYDRIVEQCEVRDKRKRLLLKYYNYISFQTDCGVGMPMRESWQYDGLGRLATHLVITIGMEHAKKYAYSNGSDYCEMSLKFPAHDAPPADSDGPNFCVESHTEHKAMTFWYYGWKEKVIWQWN